ncbi:MAG: hypothetical protein QM739_04265 [Propionivibrio sp.]
MAEPPTVNGGPLSSLWDGLSPHILASFYPVQRQGSSRNWQKIPDAKVVQAPLTECSLGAELGWSSPFENAGQSSMPTLQAMLQNGALQAFAGSDDGNASKFIGKFEGRAGITKLNSQQVFVGMQPVRFDVTAVFRAWRDSASEVMAPVNQLMKWALPQALAQDGRLLSLLESVKQFAEGKPLDEAAAEGFLPSIAPTKIAMKYKGFTYSPLVIESINLPLDSPIDANGRYVNLHVQMRICSLAAIDRDDWDSAGQVGAANPGFSA